MIARYDKFLSMGFYRFFLIASLAYLGYAQECKFQLIHTQCSNLTKQSNPSYNCNSDSKHTCANQCSIAKSDNTSSPPTSNDG